MGRAATYLVTYLGLPWTRSAAMAPAGQALGLLLGAFRDRIETEIVKNLDKLLQQKEPLKAFEKGAYIRTTGDVLAFAPPLIIEETTLMRAADVVEEALADLARRLSGAHP